MFTYTVYYVFSFDSFPWCYTPLPLLHPLLEESPHKESSPSAGKGNYFENLYKDDITVS